MHRFWNRHIKPTMDAAQPRLVMEIGAELGWNTGKILGWCRQNGAQVHVIDPAPGESLHGVIAGYEDACTFHPVRSLDAIRQIPPVDFVLLDGDHNWWTVFNELSMLFAHAADNGAAPPIVVCHDIAWPYARRDMYYSPTDLDGSHRHPYAYRGMLPGQSELSEDGMNGAFANALHEGGPRNGVLTAIEDFIDAAEVPIAFHKLPFFNGLGILIPEPRMTPALAEQVESFFTPESLMQSCEALELDSMRFRARYGQLEEALTRRTDALARARARLAEKSARIEELERALDAQRRAHSTD